jgi:hypothetical protein
MKAGLSVCEAFTAGVKRDFPEGADKVSFSIGEFFLSLPLAVRCPHGLFFCHSLPSDANIGSFDFTVFDRELTGRDYQRKTGPIYQLVWGRNMSPATAAKFAEQMDAQILVTGHQPQESGYAVNGDQHLIIASEHNQGVFIPIDLSRPYTMAELVDSIRKFVSLDV